MAETQPVVAGDQTKVVPSTQGDTVAAPTPEQTAKAPDQASASADELTPPDELRESWNSLPPEQRKIVNKAYTQARQKDAAKLKEIESKAALADALQRDPVGTFRTLEAQLRGSGLLNGQQQAHKEMTNDTEKVLAQLGEQLGPDTAGAMRALIRAELQAQIEPTQHAIYQMATETTQAKAQAEQAAFEAKYPNWKEHEAEMKQLAMKLTDNGRLPIPIAGREWLEVIYHASAREKSVRDGVENALKRMQQSAQTAEQPTVGVQSTRVAHVAPKLTEFKSFEELGRAAGEAAKRGQTWERG